METDSSVSRRHILRTAVGTSVVVGAGHAIAPVSAQRAENERPEFESLDGVDGGIEDLRGRNEVTVSVGADGNGGTLAFSPAGIWIDPGTTVIWEWTGEGGHHNVATVDGPAELESQFTAEAGSTYEYEFTEEDQGITNYHCAPHDALDMKGAVAVGDVPTTDESIGTDDVESDDDMPTDEESTGDSDGTDDVELDDDPTEDSTTEEAQNESAGDVSVEVPGFGIVSTLTGIASASYMLRRRLRADNEP